MAKTTPGTLVAVGGGEDKRDDMRILRRALEHVRGAARRVAIIPTASREPVEAARPYLDAFQGIGAHTIDVLDIRTRDEAFREAHVRGVREADLVYMTGGDQARLVDVLLDTPTHRAIEARLAAGAVVAGTSAGAAAMSATMIAQGQPTLRKGHVQLTTGLGLTPSLIIDTHFNERGRFGRLMEAVASHPDLIGMGLGEDTAVVHREGVFEIVGRGHVVIIDGRKIRSDLADVAPDQPVSVEHAIVHTLAEGRAFRLDPPPVVAPLRARTHRRARA